MAQSLRFTKPAIEALPPASAGKRDEYADTVEPGLRLRVTDRGAKTYCVLARVKGGSMERYTIGSARDFTPEQARRKAVQVRGEMKNGRSLAASKRAERGEMTFGELFVDYLSRHAKPNKRSWQEDEAIYRRCLKARFGRKQLREVDRVAIARMHSAVSKDGGTTRRRGNRANRGAPIQANRALALVRGVYSWATKAGLWSGENPARNVAKNAERPRRRYLQPNEMAAFLSAVQAIENKSARDFFLLCVLTGARRSNVMSMRWTEIDLDAGEWRIPDTKSGEPLTVPLAPEASAILQARRVASGPGAEFVFPGKGKTAHYVEPKRSWQQVRKASGLAELRIHDLRRTLGSWMVRTGASTAINAKALGHKSLQAASVYQRIADTDPVREAINQATSAILVAGNRKSAGEIRELPSGGQRHQRTKVEGRA